MNPNHRSLTPYRRAATAALVMAGALLSFSASAAEEMYKTKAYPGGLRIGPEAQSVSINGSTANVSWYGLRGSYALQSCPTLGGTWTDGPAVKTAEYGTNLSIAISGEMGFFRLKATNNFVGTETCGGCHDATYGTWAQTPHAHALATLDALGLPPSATQGCVPCHTIGNGQPTGFVDTNTTPSLANVGCENCHGAGGAHIKGPRAVIRPAVTIAAQVCGGCHTDAHHPTYDEWLESGHAHVTGELSEEFEAPGYAGQSRQMSCGACHSGAVRMAMLKNWAETSGATNSTVDLPTAEDAGTYSVTCAVCHDPHSTGNGVSLRNTNYSTIFYSFPTTTYPVTNIVNGETNVTWLNDNFAKNYNPNVQICGQCHNMRGGTWTGTSRPPHHSPQYNILIGLGGYPNTNGTTTAITHKHGKGNAKQCTQCHMQKETPDNITEENPAYTGHKFEMLVVGCVATGCHGSTNTAKALMDSLHVEVRDTINEVVGLMRQWSTTKAPTIDAGFTQYGTNAWEYTTAGQLTTGGGAAVAGPPSALQAKIPNDIKQGRFNLYLVEHDASGGVHNPEYARALLDDAKTRVTRQLQ